MNLVAVSGTDSRSVLWAYLFMSFGRLAALGVVRGRTCALPYHLLPYLQANVLGQEGMSLPT